ncbi:hypothetical protein L1887_20343 [Cichorium endivia]|nr:hypothetical protein L1887_20343 [Cichorium endivia]
MASTEQPPKKRKLYDTPQPAQPPPPEIAEPQPPASQTSANVPTTTLSQEEIARKRRNQEEITNFYESYKRLKYCISQKDARLMHELEQAYLSLITASRGCTSVQRLVAEFVPKYASYCPTALEAAAKVCINVHNWSMAIINRGEDTDGFSFETARICIFGLATICQTASSETPTSSVIQGICSTVFLNVLTFFISSFEGQEIFQIVNKDVTKMFDSPKTFSDLKQKFSNADWTPSVKLSKLRALCILWIFFNSPRSTLSACFELCTSSSTDGVNVPNGGQYFLNQVTAGLDTCDVKDSIDKDCLLGLVLDKDPSLKKWTFSTVKSIIKSDSSNIVSDMNITSAFEKILEKVKSGEKDKQVESDVDDTNPSKFTPTQFLPPKTSEVSVREGSITSNTSSNNSGGPKSMDLDTTDHKELSFSRASSSTPRDPLTSQSANRPFESLTSPHPLTGQLTWHHDGDASTMDVYSASRHVWVGSLGPDTSEGHIKFQFERFGPIDKFLYVPFKGFVVIEYNNIMDAIKAREIMKARSPWVIKFLDIGVGTRGEINGVAVGSSCFVYIGNIHSQLDKDEILYEVRKVNFKGPLAVTDLMSEGAILMEFCTPEECATVMSHLRQYRKEKRDFVQSNNMVNQGHVYQSNWNMSPMQGHYCPPSQPMQTSSYMRPMYYPPPPPPPNSSWDPHAMIHHVAPPPFLPASVTPLAQIQGNPMPHHDQMYYVPPQHDVGPPLPPPQLTMPPPQPNIPVPIHPELAPPLPPSPPPSFESQPPPPPPPVVGSHWQGTLSKSGVHYSTIHARKLHSDVCNYGENHISEPAEWPAKLDITKRTDFKHVMSTFSSTPPNKREVCQLVPTSAADHKGFGDFISYLKQRECAGVIKIGCTKGIWSRLVFILPYSHETCSLLSVTPDTQDCLIALVLPKETNFEWV